MDSDSKSRIINQRCQLVLDHPFFGVLSCQLKLVESREIPTMATDAVHLLFNPSFVDSLSDGELKTIIAHEVLHCALGHCFRMQNRSLNHKKANMAADYAINNRLDSMNTEVGAGTFPWPQKFPPLINHEWDDLAMEAIYNRIPDPPESPKGSGGDGDDDAPCGPGEILPTPATDDAEQAELEAKWQANVQQAAIAQKMRGDMPSTLKRLVEEIFEPELPWKVLLRQFVEDRVQNDYSWVRPNKSIMAATQGRIILPALDGDALGEVVVAIDTSGSIGADMLARFMAEVRSIFDDCQPSALHLIDCDARVHQCVTFERGDEVQMTFTGGGGTAFEPVFNYVEKNAITPACLIYLTDMYGSFPDEPPSYPTLWASYSSVHTAPFGEVLPVE
jgi:predicted metal-dependent peptidase